MKLVHALTKALHLLCGWTNRFAGEGNRLAYNEFLRPPGRQFRWDALEQESKVIFERGWARLQETAANETTVVVPAAEIRRLCRAYANATARQRMVLRRKVSPALAAALQHFAWRMAVRALRTKSEEAIKLGLAAVSIEDSRTDMRETLQWLSLLYHAGARIPCDVERCFQLAAALSGELTGDLIRSFPSRSPEHRDISNFAFTEGVCEQGPTLVNAPWPKPTTVLKMGQDDAKEEDGGQRGHH